MSLGRCNPRKRPQSGHRGRSGSCRYCCKSLFAHLITNFSGRRRGFRVACEGSHHAVMKSPATSVTSLTPHRLAILACLVFWRENCRPQFRTFATQSATTGPEQSQQNSLLFDDFVGASEQRRRDSRPSAFAVLRLITSGTWWLVATHAAAIQRRTF